MNLVRMMVILFALLSLLPPEAWAQLDDVRQDNLEESREEIKAISDELKRQKKLKSEKKKKAYAEKIERAQKVTAIDAKQREIISESEDLIKSIQERTAFESEKRWRYEELINIYAEKPIEEMSREEKEETANQFLASATSGLVDFLKRKAIERAKMKRGEEYEDVTAGEELVVELKQYTQLVKRMSTYKDAQAEKIILQQDNVVESTEELIDLFKEEALRRAEAKRLIEEEAEDKEGMQLKKFEGIVGLHYGYDSNVNTDSNSEGASFLRNYVSVDWVPSFNEYFKGSLGVWHLTDNYFDNSAVTFRIAAWQASLDWHPFGNNDFILQPGFEFSKTHYPNDSTLSTEETKFFANAKHSFWDKWYQELSYEDSWTDNNNNRLARDGVGDDIQGVALSKRRHAIEHTLRFPLPEKFTFKLRQKGTLQTSNDAFTDFYDYHSYKIGGEFSRSITEKLYAKADFAFEQKDFDERTVAAHQEAQEDKTHTQKLTLFYFLNDDWFLNYTWTRQNADSNDSVYDYKKNTHTVGAYYSF